MRTAVVRIPVRVVLGSAMFSLLLSGLMRPSQAQGIEAEATGVLNSVVKWGVPGVSGALAQKGRLVFAGGSGLADVPSKLPATASTVYNIGSVSKVITATALMQLIERGSVMLGDPIQKYVPGFPDKARQLRSGTSLRIPRVFVTTSRKPHEVTSITRSTRVCPSSRTTHCSSRPAATTFIRRTR